MRPTGGYKKKLAEILANQRVQNNRWQHETGRAAASPYAGVGLHRRPHKKAGGLFMGTLYKHSQLKVPHDHTVELNREESAEGRSGAPFLET